MRLRVVCSGVGEKIINFDTELVISERNKSKIANIIGNNDFDTFNVALHFSDDDSDVMNLKRSPLMIMVEDKADGKKLWTIAQLGKEPAIAKEEIGTFIVTLEIFRKRPHKTIS